MEDVRSSCNWGVRKYPPIVLRQRLVSLVIGEEGRGRWDPRGAVEKRNNLHPLPCHPRSRSRHRRHLHKRPRKVWVGEADRYRGMPKGSREQGGGEPRGLVAAERM